MNAGHFVDRGHWWMHTLHQVSASHHTNVACDSTCSRVSSASIVTINCYYSDWKLKYTTLLQIFCDNNNGGSKGFSVGSYEPPCTSITVWWTPFHLHHCIKLPSVLISWQNTVLFSFRDYCSIICRKSLASGGLCPLTPTRALSLDPTEGHLSPKPLTNLPSLILYPPHIRMALNNCWVFLWGNWNVKSTLSQQWTLCCSQTCGRCLHQEIGRTCSGNLMSALNTRRRAKLRKVSLIRLGITAAECCVRLRTVILTGQWTRVTRKLTTTQQFI